MRVIPKKLQDRIAERLKGIQSIAQTLKDRDVNESDTVTLVMDILSSLLGFDKYTEITKEHQVRSTYCDLAIVLDGKIHILIECKAIGISLKENHMQQALNYAANKGCEWVILTSGVCWQVYRVTFSQPISSELVAEIDLLSLSPRRSQDLEALFAISREGVDKGALQEFYANVQAKDRYCIASLVQSEGVLKLIRKELRAMNPNVNIDHAEILEVLRNQVLKREVVEGDKAVEADRRIRRFHKKRESGAKRAKAAKLDAAPQEAPQLAADTEPEDED